MKSINPIPDHQTEKRSTYHSEAERSIADMLDSYGIPFYYKQPTLVVENGRKCIEYVDFFLPTYAGLSIDYSADPRGHAYQRKTRVYSENQVPAALLTKRDISGKDWQQRLYRRLERMYHVGTNYRHGASTDSGSGAILKKLNGSTQRGHGSVIAGGWHR